MASDSALAWRLLSDLLDDRPSRGDCISGLAWRFPGRSPVTASRRSATPRPRVRCARRQLHLGALARGCKPLYERAPGSAQQLTQLCLVRPSHGPRSALPTCFSKTSTVRNLDKTVQALVKSFDYNIPNENEDPGCEIVINRRAQGSGGSICPVAQAGRSLVQAKSTQADRRLAPEPIRSTARAFFDTHEYLCIHF